MSSSHPPRNPRNPRNPRLPLAVAAVLAVLIHLSLLPPVSRWVIHRPVPRHPADPPADPTTPRDPRLRFGRDRPAPSTVAWISHDDFRELLAPKSKTEQPALQQEQDPVPHAPVVPDPTPPAAVAATEVSRAVPAEPTEVDSTPPPPSPTPPLAVASASGGGFPERLSPDTPLAEASPDDASPTSTAAESPIRQPRDDPSPKHPPPPSPTVQPPSNPTSAARTDQDSSPVNLRLDARQVQPGTVLVGRGIQIKTVRPRFSIVTRLSAVPTNPAARLEFDPRTGRVVNARIVRSSGYPNVDGPILASLYKWRATGSALDRVQERFELTVDLILTPD